MLTVGDSWYVRSSASRCCEANLVICPTHQSRGIGRQILQIQQSIMTELGYRTMINDYSASNQVLAAVVCSMANGPSLYFLVRSFNCVLGHHHPNKTASHITLFDKFRVAIFRL